MHSNTTAAPKLRTAAARIPPALANFDALPDSALIDVATVAALLGCSRNTVWRKARAGELASPIKTGPNSTRWRVGSIRAHLAAIVG